MKVSEATDPVWLPALSPVSYVIPYFFFSYHEKEKKNTIRDPTPPPLVRFAAYGMANGKCTLSDMKLSRDESSGRNPHADTRRTGTVFSSSLLYLRPLVPRGRYCTVYTVTVTDDKYREGWKKRIRDILVVSIARGCEWAFEAIFPGAALTPGSTHPPMMAGLVCLVFPRALAAGSLPFRSDDMRSHRFRSDTWCTWSILVLSGPALGRLWVAPADKKKLSKRDKKKSDCFEGTLGPLGPRKRIAFI